MVGSVFDYGNYIVHTRLVEWWELVSFENSACRSILFFPIDPSCSNSCCMVCTQVGIWAACILWHLSPKGIRMERLLILWEGEEATEVANSVQIIALSCIATVFWWNLLFQRLHCGCVASKNSYDLLDSGGVQCVTCMKNSAAQSVSIVPLHYPHPFSK